MRIVAVAALGSALALGIAACSDYDEEETAYAEGETTTAGTTAETYDTAGTTTGAGTATTWPAGSRIVVEEDVTYRVEPGGTRIRLGPNDALVVVEDDVRYRVDPDGTRVRIDEEGAEIRVDADGVEADVDLGQ